MDNFFCWLLSFLLLCCVFCILGYQLICLTDLETDNINPYETAARVNQVIVPEFIVHGVLCSSYLFSGHWFLFLLSLPYLYYNYRLYSRNGHTIYVAEIYTDLNKEKKRRQHKFHYLVSMMTISIFGIIWRNIDNI
ncbi:hypothetical protein MLD38_038489 [Melastoma candidum]|uniref:Uncharacterized protein n=1 Tax=Melastoma candidum TaxID=119954 RepID=A0ACB9L0J0_9MYRT|nr:hypothetical protein MLD38_038489 [Melastoma candidum]